jgi:prophage regulatory protein
MANVVLRLPAVKERTGLSRSTIYLRVAQGQFPAPVSLGARAVGWIASEVDAWLAQKITESREARNYHAQSSEGN